MMVENRTVSKHKMILCICKINNTESLTNKEDEVKRRQIIGFMLVQYSSMKVILS